MFKNPGGSRFPLPTPMPIPYIISGKSVS